MATIFSASHVRDTSHDMSQVAGCRRAAAPLLSSSLSQTDLIWSVDRDGAETMTVTAEFTARVRARRGGEEAIADSGHVRPN